MQRGHTRENLAVNVTAVPDLKDRDSLSIHSIDHAIIADPDSVVIRRASELLCVRRKRIAGESVNVSGDAALDCAFQMLELSQSGGGELDQIGHDTPR
jgi:hypothetical protein